MSQKVVPIRAEFPALKFHPLADVLPLLEGPEYEDLVASIRLNGQREEIITYEGMILDGRNRYRACRDSYNQTGKALKIKTFAEVTDEGTDPRKYVVDKNLLRRHLTTAQRAMYMAELATCSEGWPIGRTRSSDIENVEQSNTGSKEPVLSPQVAKASGLTNAEAGAMANVSASSIKDAKVVLTEGTEEEKQLVLSGEAGLRPTADQIRERRPPDALPEPFASSGPANNRLSVPEGKTPSQWCQEGMDLEENGCRGEDAAESIGMAIQTYREVRDIVLLATRVELKAKDRDQAQQALQLLDTTRMLSRSHEMVRPIAEAVWGPRGQRKGGANRRLEDFQNSVTLIVSALTRARELTLPYMPDDRAAEFSKSLRDARSSVTDLIKRIEDSSHD
jgi:hypothetical protein